MRRTSMTLAATVLLLGLLVPTALAGGGGHEGGRCPGFGEGERVLLRDGCIEGTAHFLGEGSDLTVVNEGIAGHDYTAVDGSFATGLVQPGESATVEAPAPGVYRVYCTLHATADGQGMAGVLVVGDLDAQTLAAAPATSGGGAAGGLAVPAGWLATGAVAALAALAAGMLLALRRRTGAVPADSSA